MKQEIPPFKARVRKNGNSHVVTIPYTYLQNDLLKKGKTYQFTNIREVKG